VYATYYDITVEAALRVLQDADQTEDAAQTVFVRLYAIWAEARSRPLGRAWFTTAGHHAAVSMRRSQSRTHQANDAASVAATVDPQRPDTLLEAKELRLSLQRAVTDLPTRCRAVARMCLLDGYTHREAATELDVSVKAVEKQAARARRLLRVNNNLAPDKFPGGGRGQTRYRNRYG
jgi:RNA polymerase sigma-70 factor (ECF subfamily)